MPLPEKATSFILSALLKNEELQKFPQDFITESVKWVRSWFIVDDPKTEEKLNSDRSADYKQGVIETKLETLLENPQFKKELDDYLAQFERHAAAQQTTITKEGVVEGGVTQTGSGTIDIGNKSYQAGGNIQIIHQYGSSQPDPHAPQPAKPPIAKPAVAPAEKGKLRALIGQNRIQDVIDQLAALSASYPEFQNLVIQQSQKWESLKHQEMLNVIPPSEAGVERARIVSALLELTGMLGEGH